MSGRKFKIAFVPGDCIGPEVMAQARLAADAAASSEGASFEWVEYPFSGVHYLKTGELLPDSALAEMAECDAMMLGAIGHPDVKPGPLEQDILLKLRFHFDQYINLRPARSLPNVPTPVKFDGTLDTVVVRENTEDLYMGLGVVSDDGHCRKDLALERGSYRVSGSLDMKLDSPTPFAAQVAAVTKVGTERVARYACELAKQRGESRVTVVSKSNAVPALYGFFEQTSRAVIEAAGLKYEMRNIDALCYHLVRDPKAYGVLLCPNLFGDIVSDLQAGLAGGMGTAAAGNIGDGLSMFEPVHGSAPDIAGTGRANPIAAIMSSALMMRHVGLTASADRIEGAVEAYLRESDKSGLPFEFGGSASCEQAGAAVIKHLA